MVLGLGVEGGVSSTGARVVVWRVVGAGVGLGSVRAVLGGQGLRNGRLGPQGRGRCQVAWRSKGGALGFVLAGGMELEGELTPRRLLRMR